MTHTAKHTPGPWGYNPISCDVEAIAISERIAMVETDVAWDEAKKSEIVHANGHLIAAAPAMYEALQIMVRAANVDEIDPLVMFASIERAKDALAQAEGGA